MEFNYSNDCQTAYSRFGNKKCLNTNIFDMNDMEYLHIKDLRSQKAISLTRVEFEELVANASNIVSTWDNIRRATQQQQEQQQPAWLIQLDQTQQQQLASPTTSQHQHQTAATATSSQHHHQQLNWEMVSGNWAKENEEKNGEKPTKKRKMKM